MDKETKQRIEKLERRIEDLEACILTLAMRQNTEQLNYKTDPPLMSPYNGGYLTYAR